MTVLTLNIQCFVLDSNENCTFSCLLCEFASRKYLEYELEVFMNRKLIEIKKEGEACEYCQCIGDFFNHEDCIQAFFDSDLLPNSYFLSSGLINLRLYLHFDSFDTWHFKLLTVSTTLTASIEQLNDYIEKETGVPCARIQSSRWRIPQIDYKWVIGDYFCEDEGVDVYLTNVDLTLNGIRSLNHSLYRDANYVRLLFHYFATSDESGPKCFCTRDKQGGTFIF